MKAMSFLRAPKRAESRNAGDLGSASVPESWGTMGGRQGLLGSASASPLPQPSPY